MCAVGIVTRVTRVPRSQRNKKPVILGTCLHLKCLYRHSQQGWEHLMGNLKQYVFCRSNRGAGRGTGNRLEAIIHHRSRLFAYMIDESLEEMKDTLKINGIIITSAEVKNMTYPVVAQSEAKDIETDTREDLLLI
jgi:hypothetical protein